MYTYTYIYSNIYFVKRCTFLFNKYFLVTFNTFNFAFERSIGFPV